MQDDEGYECNFARYEPERKNCMEQITIFRSCFPFYLLIQNATWRLLQDTCKNTCQVAHVCKRRPRTPTPKRRRGKKKRKKKEIKKRNKKLKDGREREGER